MNILLLFSILAALPRLAAVVEEERGAWQPVDPADIEAIEGNAALEVLTSSRLIQIEKVDVRQLARAQPDYVLRIAGRMLDEAESHTISVTLESHGKNDLPSFRANETVVIGKLPRAKMLQLIEQSSRQAAKTLLSTAHEALKRLGQGSNDPVPIEGELPWKWPEVTLGGVLHPSSSALMAGGEAGQAALRETIAKAFSDTSARQSLERCVLHHKQTEFRKLCLQAVRPHSRRSSGTQRTVIEAFRRDQERDVVNEASEQMTYFVGLAKQDAIQAWLERAAAGDVRGPLTDLGDLPHLDSVIARCLVATGKRPKYQRSKSGCLSLLPPLSVARRWAILQKPLATLDPESPLYIEGAGEREGSIGTDWEQAWKAVVEGAPRFWPGLEDILWKRFERTASTSSLDALADYAPPSAPLANRFLEVIRSSGTRHGVMGLSRLVKNKALRPAIKGELEGMLATDSFHKGVSPQKLEELIKTIDKLDAKRSEEQP